MPMSRSLITRTVTVLTSIASFSSAQPTQATSPTTGPWKDRPPGTFVVMRVVSVPSGPATFRREIMIGTDAAGRPWFGSDTAPTPTGPWSPQGENGAGSSSSDFPIVTTRLGRQDLIVAGRSFPCDVVRTEITNDASVVTTETWTAVDTAIALRNSTQTRPRDADAPFPPGGREEVATAAESRTIDGVALPAFVLEGKQTSGRRTTRFRTVISNHIAGGRLAFSRWDGDDASKPPTYHEEIVAVGVDVPALATHRLWMPPKTEAETLAEFVDQAVADMKSPAADTRARGVTTLGMNRYADADRPRVEAAIRAGLQDADVTVRRAAAVAAGNKLRGIAPAIVAMAAADPDGRSNYIEALGAAADPAGIDVILEGVRAPNGMLADISCLALSQIWDSRADAALADLAASADARVRGRLARTLARGRNQNGVDLLMRLAADPAKSVRWPAFQSLAERGDPRSLDVAVAGLHDVDADVRQSALFAVGSTGRGIPAKTVAVFAAVLADASAKPLHAFAAGGLAAFGDERAIPSFGRMLSHPDEFKSRLAMVPPEFAATHGLIKLGTPAAIRVLIDYARQSPKPQAVLEQLRRQSSPAIARAAWAWRAEALAAGGAATQPTPGDFRGPLTDQLCAIAVAGADRALRNEIDASIPAAPARRRPYLRAAVREIDKRLAKGG